MQVTTVNTNYNSKPLYKPKYQMLNKSQSKIVTFESEPYKGITNKKQRLITRLIKKH